MPEKPDQHARRNIDSALAAAGCLEDSASLPDPDVLAAEIVEDLQAALDEFALIAADLRVK
jgi:type I restriction enzyme M protein